MSSVDECSSTMVGGDFRTFRRPIYYYYIAVQRNDARATFARATSPGLMPRRRRDDGRRRGTPSLAPRRGRRRHAGFPAPRDGGRTERRYPPPAFSATTSPAALPPGFGEPQADERWA